MTGVTIQPSRAVPPVRVAEGPWLLAHLDEGPSLEAHRRHVARPGRLDPADLVAAAEAVQLRGRGGAGFPFARKLLAVMQGRGRAEMVVNVSEGEPSSFKDAALAMTRPHLILDGAAFAAQALGVRRVQLVLPGEREGVREALRTAVAERDDDGVTFVLHTADPRFVAGQAQAVLQLIAGKPNLPVTAWRPEAISGLRQRPTLLSNAETYATLALALSSGEASLSESGTLDEPGTMLMTLAGESTEPRVVEVPFGTPWERVLGPALLQRPILLGGFHGTWLKAGSLPGRTILRSEATARGFSLGAGIVLPLMAGACPVHETARIATYLAGESAGRCGPCFHGLPALAEAVADLANGKDTRLRVSELCRLLPGRGACSHPDGTVRMVASMVRQFPLEVDAHADGRCMADTDAAVAGRAR